MATSNSKAYFIKADTLDFLCLRAHDYKQVAPDYVMLKKVIITGSFVNERLSFLFVDSVYINRCYPTD